MFQLRQPNSGTKYEMSWQHHEKKLAYLQPNENCNVTNSLNLFSLRFVRLSFLFPFLFKKCKWKATQIPYPRTLSSLDSSIFNLRISFSHVLPSWIAFFSKLQTIILTFFKYICKFVCNFVKCMGFPCGSADKESTCNAGDLVSIPGLGSSPGERKGYPLQYSGLENSLGYRPWGLKESDKIESLSLSLRRYFKILIYFNILSLYLYT